MLFSSPAAAEKRAWRGFAGEESQNEAFADTRRRVGERAEIEFGDFFLELEEIPGTR